MNILPPPVSENGETYTALKEKPIEMLERVDETENTNVKGSLAYIKKKREFTIFKKLIQQGKYTTGYMAAKTCGVDEMTIQSWLGTKFIRKLFNETIDKYVDKIEAHPDWKASAYLLDKITNAKDEDQASSLLMGLSIVIQNK